MKLNPKAIEFLYKNHNKNFYQNPDITPYVYTGYLVLVADGSDVSIPTTEETLEKYVTSSRNGTKQHAQMGLGCIYDVLNRFIIDCDIMRGKFDEMRTAEKQLDKLPDTIGSEQPYFIIMDRGYPSIPSFLRLIDRNIKFVIRLKNSDFKKEQQQEHLKKDYKHTMQINRTISIGLIKNDLIYIYFLKKISMKNKN